MGQSHRTESRSRSAVAIAVVALLAVLAVPSTRARAQADTGPFFEAGPPLSQSYALRLSTAIDHATRSDFGRPLFLFRQPVERLRALQASALLDLRLSLTSRLALQAVVPLVYRRVNARIDGVLVSQTSQLSDRALQLNGFGLADVTLGVGYRLLELGVLTGFLDAGAVIPLDDNPGDKAVPERVPPDDGQGELYLGAGVNTRLSQLGLSLAYRFGLMPQATASYLVRNVSNQSYATGALALRTRQLVTGRIDYRALEWLSLSVSPQLTVLGAPAVVERGARRAIISAPYLVQLTLRAGVRLRLSNTQALEAFYRQPLLSPWDKDPLFPLAMPAQGGGLMWVVTTP